MNNKNLTVEDYNYEKLRILTLLISAKNSA